MTQATDRHRWIFCAAALAVWVASGWPALSALNEGTLFRGAPVETLWLIPFTLFGAVVLAAMTVTFRPAFQWTLIVEPLAIRLLKPPCSVTDNPSTRILPALEGLKPRTSPTL